jgi:putative hemolysin
MKKLVVPVLIIIALIALIYFVQEQYPQRQANPAAVKCVESGFEYKIRQGPAGETTGYCVFKDGSECLAWDYYYGKCFPGQTKFEDYFKITDFQQCVDAGFPVMESYPRQCRTPDGRIFTEVIPEPIGGQRDEHGCLGPAGYSWNAALGGCVRVWELDDQQKYAAKTAIMKVGQQYGLTVVEVIKDKCTGCFTVKLSDADQQQTQVKIENWKATEVN